MQGFTFMYALNIVLDQQFDIGHNPVLFPYFHCLIRFAIYFVIDIAKTVMQTEYKLTRFDTCWAFYIIDSASH